MTLPREATRTLEVLRAATAAPASETEWGQPVYAAATVHATIFGVFAQLSDDEVANLADAGARIGDWRLITPASYLSGSGSGETLVPLDLAGSDRVRDPATGFVYEVRSVIDAGGVARFLVALLRRVSEQ